MTVRILSGAPNSETRNAESLRNILSASEESLSDPRIVLDILYGLPIPQRQIDIVLLYHDQRPAELRFKTTSGATIHSFVLVVEVKQHSSDLIRFEGAKVLVRYGPRWSDATAQCDEQMWALKRYQQAAYKGKKRRSATFIQRAIWLARAPRKSFEGSPAKSSVPVHFADLTWKALINSLNSYAGEVRALVDHSANSNYHDVVTLRSDLLHEVLPTELDLQRINALTQTRFDGEKTAYIQNLGKGLLILRGRAGTGKTIALLQIALHLAREGKRTLLLTYNHGLIADIERSLRFIGAENPALIPLPEIKTRYAFIQDLYMQELGVGAEKVVREIDDIDEREEARMNALLACTERIHTCFDFVFIDEGQDWKEPQRDLIFNVFGPEHVVVADGVDQFVGQDRCNWDRGDIPINRRHRLNASRRTKSATCQTLAEIARELELSDWDLEPDPDAHGGRFTVLVESDPARAVERSLQILESDQRRTSTIRAVDNLICMPTKTMTSGRDYSALFDRAIEAKNLDSWRGFDDQDRRVYAMREKQLRAITYQSCRGMEGWTTICLGLDAFYSFQLANARIDRTRVENSIRKRHSLFLNQEILEAEINRERALFAKHWLMIPLTRSIDHLVVHINDEDSDLGRILASVSARSDGAIEWIR